MEETAEREARPILLGTFGVVVRECRPDPASSYSDNQTGHRDEDAESRFRATLGTPQTILPG